MRGRKPQPERTTRWALKIPEELAGVVDLIFFDPQIMKPAVGARSSLVARLLRAWLRERRLKWKHSNG